MKVIDRFDGEYRWLSNFYPCNVEYEGLRFRSSEAAFQAMKTLEDRERFTDLTPGKAKRLGRKVVLRDDWENIKLDVMYEVLTIKFSYTVLRKKLEATRGIELVEGNYWNDTFWGICNGIGENHLGKLLMEVRG